MLAARYGRKRAELQWLREVQCVLTLKLPPITLLGLLVQHTSISFDRVTLAHLDSIAFVEWLRLF